MKDVEFMRVITRFGVIFILFLIGAAITTLEQGSY